MLPKLKKNQSVYIEITNPIHGGPGWEFGACLWSPVRSKGGYKSWKIMEQVKRDDLVIHLLKSKIGYNWTGLSVVESSLRVINEEPPKPSRWARMKPYQRIDLQKYTRIEKPGRVTDFFMKYVKELKNLYKRDNHQFFTVYGSNNEIRVAQRYLAPCVIDLYQLFDDWSNNIHYSPVLEYEVEHVPTDNEPSYPDYPPPNRQDVSVSRIVRDTKITRELKRKYRWRCQICGKRIELPNGKYYAEGHHLKPLGSDYDGPDVKGNIIILCPNHHAEFDYGSIAIDPASNKIIHTKADNEYHNKDMAYRRDELSKEFIVFHYETIFLAGTEGAQ